MSRELYEAAMQNYIDDYLDEHPDADWTEAQAAWRYVEEQYTVDYIADHTAIAYDKYKERRREHI